MAARESGGKLLVLAKAPEPGRVKTRLSPVLGVDGAAYLAAGLCRESVRKTVAAGLAPVELWCDPDPTHPLFHSLADDTGITLRTQPEGDLGRRMAGALADALAEGGRAVLIGTDCPALTVDYLHEAWTALATVDVVLGPAEDGGYVLVGARRAVPPIFESIDWGGERVLAQTRERLRAAGLSWRELAELWDVDTPADLERLAELDRAETPG